MSPARQGLRGHGLELDSFTSGRRTSRRLAKEFGGSGRRGLILEFGLRDGRIDTSILAHVGKLQLTIRKSTMVPCNH